MKYTKYTHLPFLLADIKARALLYPFMRFYNPITIKVGTEVSVPHYRLYLEIFLQHPYKRPKRKSLPVCASISWVTVDIETPFIADTDTVRVVTFAVRSDTIDRPHCANLTVSAYVVMVTATVETSLFVHFSKIFGRQRLSVSCGRTVDNNFVDIPHSFPPSSVFL